MTSTSTQMPVCSIEAESAMAKSRMGNAIITSVMRMRKVSIPPRK